jgi:hypothetical protein
MTFAHMTASGMPVAIATESAGRAAGRSGMGSHERCASTSRTAVCVACRARARHVSASPAHGARWHACAARLQGALRGPRVLVRVAELRDAQLHDEAVEDAVCVPCAAPHNARRSARTRRKMALRPAHLARLSAGCQIVRCRSARPGGGRAG